jgi:hypothetical protein
MSGSQPYADSTLGRRPSESAVMRVMPTAEELQEAHERFLEREARDLFYRLALDLLDRARHGDGNFSVAEAVAVVLQTWNRRFYIKVHGGRFPPEHFADIETLLARYADELEHYRQRSLDSLEDGEQAAIEALFNDFDLVIGPVGAAKALHVLAPEFFPIWDTTIAQAAGYYFGKRGTNANRYWRWILDIKAECDEVGGQQQWGPGLLKRIDEFKYCRYTLKVM